MTLQFSIPFFSPFSSFGHFLLCEALLVTVRKTFWLNVGIGQARTFILLWKASSTFSLLL